MVITDSIKVSEPYYSGDILKQSLSETGIIFDENGSISISLKDENGNKLNDAFIKLRELELLIESNEMGVDSIFTKYVCKGMTNKNNVFRVYYNESHK